MKRSFWCMSVALHVILCEAELRPVRCTLSPCLRVATRGLASLVRSLARLRLLQFLILWARTRLLWCVNDRRAKRHKRGLSIV